jgi:hypothetical protein
LGTHIQMQPRLKSMKLSQVKKNVKIWKLEVSWKFRKSGSLTNFIIIIIIIIITKKGLFPEPIRVRNFVNGSNVCRLLVGSDVIFMLQSAQSRLYNNRR